jgi:hypothetical protein
MSISKPSEIKVNEIEYKEPKTLGNGGKQVYLEYNGGKLVVQTPKMSLPWSMGKFEGDNGQMKYSIDLSFKGKEDNEKLGEFHDFLEKFDEQLVKEGVSHSMAWFKKKGMNEEVLRALFSKQIRESKDKETGEPDGKWPSTVKVKLPFKDGRFQCEVYDNKKKQIDSSQLESTLVRGCEVQALIEHTGIWFAGGKYGCSWRVIQMKVTAASSIKGYAFIDSSDDEDLVDSDVDAGAGEPSKPNSNFVEDSDSDILDSDEDDDPAPPKKTGKKKK